MRINADFSATVIVDSSNMEWVRSPESGVDRIMLDRIGDEVARATSIVRYAPDSAFSRHEHAKGEEFLVLEGIFSDEKADYGTGTYVRNPPGSGHAPYSKGGCRILVKLRQFAADDLTRVVVDTGGSKHWQSGDVEGMASLLLHRHGTEKVQMLRLGEGKSVTLPADGTEVLVVNGSIEFAGAVLPRESWLRVPEGRSETLIAVADSVLWLKQGHLPKSSFK